jgi:hypothetical protein
MPKYKQPETHISESVEVAYRENGEIGAVQSAIIKYAKVLDMTDSGRDIRPLVTGMFEAIDRLKSLEASNGGTNNTALFKILEKADKQNKAVNE